MDAFSEQLLDRLPLGSATLELFDYAFDDALLSEIYQTHRGRCYEDVLKFEQVLRLVRDALLEHGGSGHQLYTQLDRDGRRPSDESSFYRKLANMPVGVSRALLRQCTARLRSMTPPSVTLPACFDGLEAIVLDGKKIKNAARRLAPTRGFGGRLLGAKALVAMDARRSLAVAMSDSLDGEANDVPLVPTVLPQVHQVIDEPILWLADRQFGDGSTLRQLNQRQGDHFVVRVRKGLVFTAESTQTLSDKQGRVILDELGELGRGKAAMRVRRVTLQRPDEGDDDVQLVSDLLDDKTFIAANLLSLYRRRWGIERMFQEVTETFSLRHLIGCRPRAILFQFALCLLMYNLVQVIKTFVAAAGAVEVLKVSTHGLFYDIKRELSAWSYLGDADWTRTPRDTKEMTERLRELLHDSWDPVAYTKASDKKPRKPKPPPKRIPGGHTSVQRLLDKANAGAKA